MTFLYAWNEISSCWVSQNTTCFGSITSWEWNICLLHTEFYAAYTIYYESNFQIRIKKICISCLFIILWLYLTMWFNLKTYFSKKKFWAYISQFSFFLPFKVLSFFFLAILLLYLTILTFFQNSEFTSHNSFKKKTFTILHLYLTVMSLIILTFFPELRESKT